MEISFCSNALFIANLSNTIAAPFFAKGAGSELFHRFADEIDPMRGKYLDNAEVGTVMHLLVEKVEKAQ